jgi:hypothetical protein
LGGAHRGDVAVEVVASEAARRHAEFKVLRKLRGEGSSVRRMRHKRQACLWGRGSAGYFSWGGWGSLGAAVRSPARWLRGGQGRARVRPRLARRCGHAPH